MQQNYPTSDVQRKSPTKKSKEKVQQRWLAKLPDSMTKMFKKK
jgi:hypothetical protein